MGLFTHNVDCPHCGSKGAERDLFGNVKCPNRACRYFSAALFTKRVQAHQAEEKKLELDELTQDVICPHCKNKGAKRSLSGIVKCPNDTCRHFSAALLAQRKAEKRERRLDELKQEIEVVTRADVFDADKSLGLQKELHDLVEEAVASETEDLFVDKCCELLRSLGGWEEGLEGARWDEEDEIAYEKWKEHCQDTSAEAVDWTNVEPGTLWWYLGLCVNRCANSMWLFSDFLRHHYRIVLHVIRSEVPVDAPAVQEVLDALELYDASLGILITNSNFTGSAESLAAQENLRFEDMTKAQDSPAAQSESYKHLILLGRDILAEQIGSAMLDLFEEESLAFQSALYSVRLKDWAICSQMSWETCDQIS